MIEMVVGIGLALACVGVFVMSVALTVDIVRGWRR